MNTPYLLPDDPPQLSDQAASEILDFLYEMVNAFENQYAQQLRRYQQSIARLNLIRSRTAMTSRLPSKQLTLPT